MFRYRLCLLSLTDVREIYILLLGVKIIFGAGMCCCSRPVGLLMKRQYWCWLW